MRLILPNLNDLFIILHFMNKVDKLLRIYVEVDVS